MSRTRVQVDTLAIRGMPDARPLARGLQGALADRLRAEIPTSGVPTTSPARIGSISLKLPPGTDGAGIGDALARVIAEIVRNGRRLR